MELWRHGASAGVALAHLLRVGASPDQRRGVLQEGRGTLREEGRQPWRREVPGRLYCTIEGGPTAPVRRSSRTRITTRETGPDGLSAQAALAARRWEGRHLPAVCVRSALCTTGGWAGRRQSALPAGHW